MDRIDILIVLAAGIFFMLVVLVFVLLNAQRGKEEKHKSSSNIKKRQADKKPKQNVRSLESNIPPKQPQQPKAERNYPQMRDLPMMNDPFESHHENKVNLPKPVLKLPVLKLDNLGKQIKQEKKEPVKQVQENKPAKQENKQVQAEKQVKQVKQEKKEPVKQVQIQENKPAKQDNKQVQAQEKQVQAGKQVKQEKKEIVQVQEKKKENAKKIDLQQKSPAPPSPAPVIGEFFDFQVLDNSAKKKQPNNQNKRQNQNQKQNQNQNQNQNNNNKRNQGANVARGHQEKKLSPEEIERLEFQKKKDREWEEHLERERKRKEEEESAWHDGKKKKKSKPSLVQSDDSADNVNPDEPVASQSRIYADQIAKENQEIVARLGKLLSDEFERKLSGDALPVAPVESDRAVDSPKKVNSPVAPAFNRWNVQSKVRTFGDEYKRIDLSIKDIENRFSRLR